MKGLAMMESVSSSSFETSGLGLRPCTLPLSALIAERITTHGPQLPVLPEAAAQVSEMVEKNASASALAEVIKRDPTIAGNVLRVANTAGNGSRVRITSLQQAISRLGFTQVRQIALAIACRSRIFCVPGYDAEVREAFRHSFATAWYAQKIARLRRSNVDEAFLSGLLHDVGTPVLYQLIVDIQNEYGIKCERDMVEQTVDQFHAQVGEDLCEPWALSAPALDAIARHHDDLRHGEVSPMLAMIQLADHLALHALEHEPAEEIDLRRSVAVEHLNLYGADVDALFAMRDEVVAVVGACK